jgi:hypothetical protein
MIKFLIILLCIFFIIRTLSRLFIVSTFGSLNKKMENEWKRRQQQDVNAPEGHISINSNDKKRRGNNDSDDEYTEYEEIK